MIALLCVGVDVDVWSVECEVFFVLASAMVSDMPCIIIIHWM